MIKLIDGKGQLGTALHNLISKERLNIDVIIYHTWNFSDKSEEVQKKCYEDFKKFVDQNLGSKIIFISTISQDKTPYVIYKKMSEEYLLKNNKNGFVIRLPTLIGKGICQKFRNNEVDAFGEMEVMTIEDATKSVLNFTQSSSPTRNLRLKGIQIPAKLIKNLILFGRNGK